MAIVTNGCIFQWKIKNIPFSENTEDTIISPAFIPNGLSGTKWVVRLFPRRYCNGEYYVESYLERQRNCIGPHYIVINAKLAFLDKNGCILKDKTKMGYEFTKGLVKEIHFMRLVKEADKEVFLPQNTHDRTVQCIIWNNYVKPINPQPIHAQLDCSNGRQELYYGTTSPLLNQSRVIPVLSDLKSMYKEGIFSDTELGTSTQTFPAHKNILSARSPVFRGMFSSDMKRKTDLDEDTVHRMLLYIYTDALDDLQFESACKLYVAADKYEILSLRSSCSSFFIANLTPANAGDIIILADRHQDDQLKFAVQDFIFKHDKEVLCSQDWKDFMDANNKLAADVLYWIALRRAECASGHCFSPC